MKNQNIKFKEQIKVTIVLFSNNCYPLDDVYNLETIVNKLPCFQQKSTQEMGNNT
jgi:hypothetical protein